LKKGVALSAAFEMGMTKISEPPYIKSLAMGLLTLVVSNNLIWI